MPDQAGEAVSTRRFREGDGKVNKLNATFDRVRGIFLILVPLTTLIVGALSMIALMRTQLGYASIVPAARILTVEQMVDTLKRDVAALTDRTRPLLIQLCFEASDTVLALIQDDVNCEHLIPRRRR